MPRHQAPAHDQWDPFRRQAAQHLHRLAHAAGRRHRRGWAQLDLVVVGRHQDVAGRGDQADFARFSGRGGGHGWGPRGGRAARGDIRAAILVLLSEQPSHGYQIIQEVEARSGGTWRVSPGSVYPTLQQLEDEGLVRPAESESGRRVYELTDAGRDEATRLSAGPAPWDEVAGAVGDDFVELRDLVVGMVAATWQVAHASGRPQLSQAKEILRDARRRLYLLLADEAPSSPATPEQTKG